MNRKVSRNILIVMGVLLICYACNCKQKNVQDISNVYPYTDTITLGLKSDSGSYATLEYAMKYLGKGEDSFAGSSSVKLGSQTWHIVTMRGTIHDPAKLEAMKKRVEEIRKEH